MRRVACCLALALFAAAAAAEHRPDRPLFRSFGSAEGLPSATVYKLAQDRTGNLWIATTDGLARYDGIGFEVWRHRPDQPHSLPGNDVQYVYVDRRDRVWAGITRAGLARLDRDSGEFLNWRHDPDDDSSLPGDEVWSIAEDADGSIWIGTYQGGLARLEDDRRFRRFRHEPQDPHSLCDNTILSLRAAGDILWIGTSRGLCRYRAGDGFSRVGIDPPGVPAARMVLQIQTAADGGVWLATDQGLRGLDRDLRVLADLPAELMVYGQGLAFGADGSLWYGSNSGLRRYWRQDGRVAVHRAQPGHLYALQTPQFTDVLGDREGGLWFGSNGGGLVQLPARWPAIRAYPPDPQNPQGLPSGRIRMLSSDRDGRLWLVTEADVGPVELDPANGIVRRVFAADRAIPPAERVTAVLKSRDGHVWTGHRGYLERLDPASGQRRRIDGDGRTTFPTLPVMRLVEHPDGSLLAALGRGGLVRIEPGTLAIEHFGPESIPALPCSDIDDIRFDARQRIWLACENGVVLGDAGARRFERLPGSPDALVDGLGFARDGTLWLHRIGALAQYRIDDGGLHLLREVGSADGWPALQGSGLFVDGSGQVWVMTPRGLYRYDPASRRIRRYDQNDGLPSSEFTRTPPVALDADTFAAGTLAGPVIVDTRLLAQPLPSAPLHLHLVDVRRGKDVLRLSPVTAPIALAHDDRELRVAVRLASFANPGAHRYRFRLDGFDSDWVELTGTPERVFSQLPSGAYTLRVEAFGGDGQPASNALALPIEVGLPPWRRPWAYALYALALALLAFAAQYVYRRRLERRHAFALAQERQHWAEQASEAKTRFLASVGHEIRTPMAGLLGMNALLLDSPLDARQRHYAQSVKRAGEHMLTLVNDLLDLSRIEAGRLTLEPGAVDLVALADDLIGATDAAAEAKGLTLSARIEPGTPLAVNADGKRLKQILLNFLSNAIKFTPRGRVRLTIAAEDGRHLFAVDDDGPGLSEEMRRQLFTRYSQDTLGRSSGGSGLGLAIAHELAQLMGGEVGVDRRAAGGSRFWLRVPLAARDDAPLRATASLPPLLVLDADAVRADDLVASLRAVGAGARRIGSAEAAREYPGSLLVMAADSCADADAALARAGLHERPAVLSLPLAASVPALPAHRRALSGPWRMQALLDACIALQAREDAPAVPAATAPSQHDLAGMRLLLVEDDAILREVLIARLQGMHALVDAVDNGLAALAAATSGGYDAVLLDLDLPELDGLTVLRLLRQRLGEATPPTFIITARQQPDDESQSLQAGARAFFRKPVDLPTLAAALAAVRK